MGNEITPLEINEAIAKAKGMTWQGMTVGHLMINSPNWAESIADAWELFEEMNFPNIHKIDNSCYECSYQGLDTLRIYETSESAPTAICLAWLKWKQK